MKRISTAFWAALDTIITAMVAGIVVNLIGWGSVGYAITLGAMALYKANYNLHLINEKEGE